MPPPMRIWVSTCSPRSIKLVSRAKRGTRSMNELAWAEPSFPEATKKMVVAMVWPKMAR